MQPHLGHSTQGQTVISVDETDEKPRCRALFRFASACGTVSGVTDDTSGLLRSRLRLVAMVLLFIFAIRSVSDFLYPSAAMGGGAVGWVIRIATMIFLLLASAVLWSPWPLWVRTLRRLELAIFGAGAIYVGWLQIGFIYSGILSGLEMNAHNATAIRLAGNAYAFRWLLVIVVYGMFIPNTWRRCAKVVGFLALLPIALTVSSVWFDRSAADYVRLTLPDTVVLMVIAAMIAVFGSHKLRELHEQVHEARKLGQYELKQKLGVGGMGEVYLAEHVLLRRPCAVKLIRPEQAGDRKTLLRFEREVQLTATLTHWNSIEIFDYGHSEDGVFYYVMEYLPGMDLEELVERHGPMPPERVVHLLRQVCEALREAHGVGLIHRDIKPSNIFACERGKVHDVAKLLDFGLVKSMSLGTDSKLTQAGSLACSPEYVSPEQAAGREDLDGRSDIYNVGAVAYFLTTGRLVFDRDDAPLRLLHAHAYEPFVPSDEFKSNVPLDLQTIVLRCLEKDPSHRYADAEELERALAACECAAAWTRHRAKDWWQEIGSTTSATPAHEELPSELSIGAP
jgi:eukaryotic-like serine/threonine-protein kinase